jgi:hypothetical protein
MNEKILITNPSKKVNRRNSIPAQNVKILL